MSKAATSQLAVLVVVAVVLGIVGYAVGYYTSPREIAGEVTRTVTQAVTQAVTQTVTRTVTQTVTPPATTTKAEFVLHAAYLTAPSLYDTHHYFFTRFKEKVESRTGGRVQVILHPGGELGDQAQYLELMATGQLFIATIEVSRFAAYTDKLNFLSFPGLFRDTEEAMAFAESDWLLEYSNSVLNRFGWTVLGITVGGARYFLSVPEKPITSLDSFRGLVLRVMNSPPYIEAAKALGANPQTIAYAECYTALQTKIIDAMENEVGAIIAMRFYEVAPNIALIPWAYAWHFVVASKQLLDSLPSDIRQVVIEAAREASMEKNAWGLFVEQVIGIQYLIDQGANIIRVNIDPIFDRLQKEFIPKFADRIPQGALQWLENYRKSVK